MVVFVEASVLEDPALARDPRFQDFRDRLKTFRDGTDELQVTIIAYHRIYDQCIVYHSLPLRFSK